MDEIATGSFKLDACGGPKQAGPFLSVERRLKKKSYMKSPTILICEKIYQILRRSTTNSREVFFSFKSIKTERVIRHGEKRASVHSKLLVLIAVQFVAEVRRIIWNWILSPNRIFSSSGMIHWIHASQRF